VALTLLAVFGFGFAWRDIQNLKLPEAQTFLALLGGGKSSGGAVSSVHIFRGSYNRISARYAGKIDQKELKYAAMHGMMAALGDPHTIFLPPTAAENFSIETRAQFVGVGARLSPDPLGAQVAVVFEDGPGYRAGLRAGDWVTGVDGKPVGGMDLQQIVGKIRGEAGTYVTLRLLRKGHKEPITIRVRREKVETPTVTGKVLEGNRIGYIALESFSEPTGEQFERALRKLEMQGIRALIVDVRGNPGGLLDSARELLSYFVDGKVVVKMKMRGGREEVVPSFSGQRDLIRIPTAVLIDEDSASAAEIFAGVLKEYRLATLVGEHTYGKSAVQNMFKLKDNASAKITIAKYLLPSGHDVGRKVDEDGMYLSGGLEPDVEVELDPMKAPIIGEPASDAQLAAAIQVLNSKIR
jgi:carboxyl-terminal processing protease